MKKSFTEYWSEQEESNNKSGPSDFDVQGFEPLEVEFTPTEDFKITYLGNLKRIDGPQEFAVAPICKKGYKPEEIESAGPGKVVVVFSKT